jgi:hypothetical protein
LNKPVSTVVVAIEIPGAPAAPPADLKSLFDQLVAAPCATLGYATQEAGGLNLTVTLSPEAAADAALRRIAVAVAEYDAKVPMMKARGLFHYGTVFRNEGTGGRVTYLGSAIRAAQTNLRRITAAAGIFASRDFADYVVANRAAFSLEVAAGTEEVRPVRFAERRQASGGEVPGSDPQFLATLKKRLAQDIGPFAGPLVDNTKHSTMSARELVNALSHEIDKPEARQKFEVDMLAYIKSRSRP